MKAAAVELNLWCKEKMKLAGDIYDVLHCMHYELILISSKRASSSVTTSLINISNHQTSNVLWP